MSTQQTIDLATRIQRRRDFTAHFVGFMCGAALLVALHLSGLGATVQLIVGLLVWATALSTQHFGHVLRGPVTLADVNAEHERLAVAPR